MDVGAATATAVVCWLDPAIIKRTYVLKRTDLSKQVELLMQVLVDTYKCFDTYTKIVHGSLSSFETINRRAAI